MDTLYLVNPAGATAVTASMRAAERRRRRLSYLVWGAQACILHGLVRTTEDVDILVEATDEICQRVIDALGRMEDLG